MSRKRHILPSAFPQLAMACSLLLLLSCASDNNSEVATSGNGTVALYMTDDSSEYQQVNISVNKVELINSGTRQTCSLIASPLTLDVARLAHIMDLVGMSECPAGAYNRIRLELDQEMYLSDGTSSSSCMLAYSRDAADVVEPLVCDQVAGTCSLDLATAVRRSSLDVLAGHINQLAIDFVLSSFSVDNFGDPAACSVTMKAAALQLSEIVERQDLKSISGRVAGLDTAARTFTLKSGHRPFTVDYGSLSETVQPGINQMLAQTEMERFTVMVRTDHIDMESRLLKGSALEVRIKGTVSGLDPAANTFVLTFKPPDRSVTIAYAAPTLVLGPLADQDKVETIVYGFDAVTGHYRASIVAQDKGTGTD